MHLKLATLTSVLVLAVSLVDLPVELERFIESKEKLVKDLASFAAELYRERSELVPDCECSKHACSNDWVKAQCVREFGTPSFCEAEGMRFENTTMVQTPPGTNPNHWSPNLIESACVFKHIDEFLWNNDAWGCSFVGMFLTSR